MHRHSRNWHYQTIDNQPYEPFPWDERDKHPNELADKSAMDKCCSMHGCANGRSVDLTQDNVWIQRGLLWVKSTMQPVKSPENPTCFLCLDNGKGHLLEALESKKSVLEGRIEYSWEAHQKAEINAIDYKDDAERAEDNLKEINKQIAEVEVL